VAPAITEARRRVAGQLLRRTRRVRCAGLGGDAAAGGKRDAPSHAAHGGSAAGCAGVRGVQPRNRRGFVVRVRGPGALHAESALGYDLARRIT
jgi:hypothetical protein